MRRVTVLLPQALSHGFDYTVPDDMDVGLGDIVEVTLSKKTLIGVVWSEGSSEAIDPKKLKPILRRFDTVSAFTHAYRHFIDWVADYTMAPRGAVMKMALSCPKALLSPPRKSYDNPSFSLKPLVLSDEQQQAAQHIIASPPDTHHTFLLDGITGSGKTETYCTAIAARLAQDSTAQILVMLPEIALTHQMVERFTDLFGAPPVLWHSGLAEAERKRAFLAICKGKAPLILGARSALFLPYKQLAMIVVDEEHEQSYKQEDGVLYQARDMAVARGAKQKCPVVLVSATPSLETLSNARSGKYIHLRLTARYAGARLPELAAIDMRSEVLASGDFISPTLRAAMLETLAKKQQILLFLNRRGYAPLLLCRSCGHRFMCNACSAWLVLHKRTVASRQSPVASRQQEINAKHPQEAGTVLSDLIAQVSRPKQEINAKHFLSCHHCGYHEPYPSQCPTCDHTDCLVSCGPGVERIAEEVAAFLPEARLSILSSDSSVSTEEITAITTRQRDIIIGTQMVAKGYHFPDLTLVGIIDGDLGLQGADLRASERCFQLLYQVSGRAGRAACAGNVLVQTYLPEHPVMQALLAADRDAFMALEEQGRKQGSWPPFGQLASLLFDGVREAEVRAAAQMAARLAPRDSRIRVLGPAPAVMARVRGHYRYRLLIKTTRAVHLQAVLSDWCAQLSHPRSVRLKVDMNPYNFM